MHLFRRPVKGTQHSCLFTFLYFAAVTLYLLSLMIVSSMTLNSSVLLYLSDAGSLWECRQLTVEQLSINRSSPGQVSPHAVCDL